MWWALPQGRRIAEDVGRTEGRGRALYGDPHGDSCAWTAQCRGEWKRQCRRRGQCRALAARGHATEGAAGVLDGGSDEVVRGAGGWWDGVPFGAVHFTLFFFKI